MTEKLPKDPINPNKKQMQILEVLAKVERPLSSRDIEKKILGPEKVDKKKRDPDVYRIIKDELCIQKFNYGFFLFDWNELLSSIYEKEETTYKKRIQSKVIDNLNSIGLDLVDYDYNRVKISKDHDSVITVVAPRRSNPNISRLIKIQKESKDYATITVFDDGKKVVRMSTPLTIKKVGKKEQQIFYEGIIGNPVKEGTSYLKVSLDESDRKKVEERKSMHPDLFNCNDEIKKKNATTTKSELLDDTTIISAVSEIESDRKNWKYSLNTRGLILYTLDMVKIESEENRVRNVEVSKVLQNLSENYIEEFPFLIYYKEIKELYDKLATEKGILEYEYFQVKLLKQIALELQHNVDTINKKELDYYITKRYSNELTKRFVDCILPGSVFGGLVEIIPVIIRRYLVHNLACLKAL